MYNTGKTTNVRKVAVINPPITTVANGFCTSAPEPVDNAIGKKPNEATVAVINTGRNLTEVPFRIIAFMSVIPSFFSRLNSLINTMPFNTATPNSAIKPTPAEMLNGIPLNHKANTPPIALIGIAVKMSSEYLIEPNVKNRSRRINANATGTATDNLLLASSRFLNCPP